MHTHHLSLFTNMNRTQKQAAARKSRAERLIAAYNQGRMEASIPAGQNRCFTFEALLTPTDTTAYYLVDGLVIPCATLSWDRVLKVAIRVKSPNSILVSNLEEGGSWQLPSP